MEKSYVLKINDGYVYYRKLENVKKFLIECGVDDVLFDEDDEVVYSLDNLEEIVGMSLVLTNKCLCERGDDYCEFYLGEIEFED